MRGVWLGRLLYAQRPPGLAPLASDYQCGSSELALVSKWVGPIDQRPANELYCQATAELCVERLDGVQAMTDALSVAAQPSEGGPGDERGSVSLASATH